MDKVTLTKEECHIMSHALEMYILQLERHGNKCKNRQAFEEVYRNHINAMISINEKLNQR